MAKRCALLLAVAVLAFSASCNDPQRAAANLFLNNGLHLISPLRSYIELGGLVIVPKSGSMYYVDALDPVPQPEVVDFKSVLGQQNASDASGLSLVLNALKKLVNAPVSFNFDANQQVKLSQVEASGRRLKTPAVQTYISGANTSQWIKKEVAGAKARAFVIYEVYRASSLTLESANGTALNVSLSVGGSTKPAAGGAGSSSGCASTGGGSTPSPQAGGGTLSASGYWIRSSTFQLTLCGSDEYPFAVRVAEVALDQAGALDLKPGSFKFPGPLAVASEVARYTARLPKTAGIVNLPRPGGP